MRLLCVWDHRHRISSLTHIFTIFCERCAASSCQWNIKSYCVQFGVQLDRDRRTTTLSIALAMIFIGDSKINHKIWRSLLDSQERCKLCIFYFIWLTLPRLEYIYALTSQSASACIAYFCIENQKNMNISFRIRFVHKDKHMWVTFPFLRAPHITAPLECKFKLKLTMKFSTLSREIYMLGLILRSLLTPRECRHKRETHFIKGFTVIHI